MSSSRCLISLVPSLPSPSRPSPLCPRAVENSHVLSFLPSTTLPYPSCSLAYIYISRESVTGRRLRRPRVTYYSAEPGPRGPILTQ
eukprot:750594-Hanusia_phi.AAC.3